MNEITKHEAETAAHRAESERLEAMARREWRRVHDLSLEAMTAEQYQRDAIAGAQSDQAMADNEQEFRK